VIAGMTLLNMVGSQAVAKVQTVVVYVVLGILSVFAVTTIATMEPSLLAFSGYPSLQDVVSGVALTFFAFLGFGVITFTAKDLEDPAHQLPRAMYLALTIATVIYVAVALGVFGTLTVQEVIDSGGTALAVAAEPVLGRAGYWLMSVTALFATSGATNAGLYPATGLCDQMAAVGQFPPVMSRRVGSRVSVGLLVTALAAMILAVGFDLSSIASIGSAVALLVFTLITASHLRVRGETGASPLILTIGMLSTGTVLVTFAVTTLVDEPATLVLLAVIIGLSALVDVLWKRSRGSQEAPPPGTTLEGEQPASA
jgi:amino acid transporter